MYILMSMPLSNVTACDKCCVWAMIIVCIKCCIHILLLYMCVIPFNAHAISVTYRTIENSIHCHLLFSMWRWRMPCGVQRSILPCIRATTPKLNGNCNGKCLSTTERTEIPMAILVHFVSFFSNHFLGFVSHLVMTMIETVSIENLGLLL